MKPGKKEKIRFGQAPTKTLPTAPSSSTEDAGAVQVAQSGQEPANPLDAAPVQKKTRFSERAKLPKETKQTTLQKQAADSPTPPDAAEVTDRQAQSAPLGPEDPNAKKKKPTTAATGEKTRLSDRKNSTEKPQPPEMTPVPQLPGAPAPAPQPPAQTPPPAPQPSTPQQ
jgi:peptidyl-prolyl cis-trans isomerase SurA